LISLNPLCKSTNSPKLCLFNEIAIELILKSLLGIGHYAGSWYQNSYNYNEGVLFIDVVDSDKNELVWQGIGKGYIYTSISNIFFLLPLVSSKINFLGIDNDNIITAINMRSKIRFVFAS